jgi:hypothetical protein
MVLLLLLLLLTAVLGRPTGVGLTTPPHTSSCFAAASSSSCCAGCPAAAAAAALPANTRRADASQLALGCSCSFCMELTNRGSWEGCSNGSTRATSDSSWCCCLLDNV